MDVAIRKVTPARIPELLKLIRELAKFERLGHEVQATVESLRKHLCGSKPAAGALIVECDGKLAGYAVYFFTFSTFVGRPGIWLDDVYVRPKFRHLGVGRRLIEAVARIGARRNCGRFEWTVLNWNKKALDFYVRLGAQVMDDWLLIRQNESGLRRLAASSANTSRPSRRWGDGRGVPTGQATRKEPASASRRERSGY
jgi:GNAT superfamily N-acetyltransferase